MMAMKTMLYLHSIQKETTEILKPVLTNKPIAILN